MSEFLEEAPSYWKHRLVLPAVPKNGEPYEDEFSLKFDRPVSYWSQAYTFKTPLFVRVEAYRSEGRVLANISLSAKAEVSCARCLEPAGVAIDGDLRYLFSLRPNEQSENGEGGAADGDEELIQLDSWEDEIDLAPLVWETLITALPATVLCSEECKGLCPQCGANLNRGRCSCDGKSVDPRLEILRSFSADKSAE